MDRGREQDEHLERLYCMKEDGEDSLDTLKSAMGADFNRAVIDELSSGNLVRLTREGCAIALTQKGTEHARRVIRAHRIAERLLYDVLGGEFEPGACEFEHIVTPELVDGICTLLGHPRECPHGMPIPEGECCRRREKTAESSVIPLIDLKVGQSARVAYVHCRNDRQLHRLDGLQIRPRASIKVHQTYPSYVIECEGGFVALDEDIVSNIFVLKSL